MSDVIISVENLGKKYRITHQAKQRSSYKSLREIASNGAKDLLRTSMAFARRQHSPDESRFRSSKEDFWALRNVSFDVERGQILGIIGRNGAGKSTLLKVLSRITEPSEGRVTLRGRVASLLEVGTGFHPELTGRENIFLNGSVVGMTSVEIKRKFDEIVEFAGVEKFLDTPVKRYSSGMYVRLAFSVAAHLEPEILVVDEVLAVGDAEFQKKCIGKMQDVAQEGGRTVLFVSHNIAAITSLTREVVFLDGGKLQFIGPTDQGVTRYIATRDQAGGRYDSRKLNEERPHISKAWITPDGGAADSHISGRDMTVTFEIQYRQPPMNLCFSFQIANQYQQPIVHCWIYDINSPICPGGNTVVTLQCRLPQLALNVGMYSLTTYLSEPPGGGFYERLEGICEFDVEIVGKQTLFGWRPDACAYIHDFAWSQL